MDIDCGRVYGFMSKQGFNGKKVCSVFIKMGTKSMAECMAGNPVFPPQLLFVQGNVMWDMLMVQRPA